MPKGILLLHNLVNRELQFIKAAMQAIGHRQLLEVQPETLNRVEIRTVLGQPHDQEAVFVHTERRLNGLAAMVGGIIHYHHQMLTRIDGQQVFDEGDKGVTVLARIDAVTDLSAVPVVAAKDMQMLRGSGCRDQFALSTFHPAAAQRWMQAYCGFVHKEEFGVGNGVKGDVFFNHSSICAAVS